MRSTKARFFAVQEKYPEPYSSYICFARAVRGQKFNYEIISKWFNVLIEKDDYASSERKEIVDYLHYLSNRVEEKAF